MLFWIQTNNLAWITMFTYFDLFTAVFQKGYGNAFESTKGLSPSKIKMAAFPSSSRYF